jgi:hypothetical protein
MKRILLGVPAIPIALHLWWTHAAPPVPITAAQAARYPNLNPQPGDAWVVPVQGTPGLGAYKDSISGLSIRVVDGYFGSFTGDDACGAAKATGYAPPYVPPQVPERRAARPHSSRR